MFRGCPDSDGDGTPDTEDGCPSLPGSPEDHGCPPGEATSSHGGSGCAVRGGRDCPEASPELQAVMAVPLERIGWHGDSARLLPESVHELQRLARLLQLHGSVELEIHVHTHGKMSARRAQELTEERARALVSEFVQQGVDPRRLTGVGMGNEHPVGTNRTRRGRAANDRVELHPVGYDRGRRRR